MFKNYMKIALRNLNRHKGYSFINLFGLSIGLVCVILILLWVLDELSYDKFHDHAENIYRVILTDKTYQQSHNYPVTPPPLAAALKQDFPEVMESARFYDRGYRLVSFGDKKFKEQISYTDPTVFDIFSFNFVNGDSETALQTPFTMIISESTVKKYFNDENPMNQILTIDNRFDFKITGIIQDLPGNSSLKTEFMIPFEQLRVLNNQEDRGWKEWSIFTYIRLQDQADVSLFEQKISDYPKRFENFAWEPSLRLQSFRDQHIRDINGGGIITFIYVFTVIAVFILLIACINFMNLATARSALRSKEIGLRKVIGAAKKNLIGQFFGESLLLAFMALFFSLFLVEILLPVFNNIAGKSLALSFTENGLLIPLLLLITLFTGLVAGSYPALYLSSIQPIYALKGRNLARSSFLRKLLVVFQFVLSVILIFSTIVVSKQMHFVSNRNPGFDRDHIVYVPLNSELRKKYDLVKNELIRRPEIQSVSAVSSYLGSHAIGSIDINNWDGNDGEKSVLVNVMTASYDFLETFGVELEAGRYFSKLFTTDSAAIILNETAARAMELENPVGTRMLDDYTVIGVIRDFNFESLHTEIKPLALFVDSRDYRHIAIKIDGNNIAAALRNIEHIATQFSPDFPFEYQFLDEQFDEMYRSEQQLGKIFNAFAILAIIISCLGLIGLASFMAQRRTREIGIRKVLGSSVSSIVMLLSSDFAKLILVSNIVAWPVAWLVMHHWLQDFAYRTKISWWIFLASGLISFFIAMLSVVFQAVRAATVNPGVSLKYE